MCNNNLNGSEQPDEVEIVCAVIKRQTVCIC
jgi:hypothetical protein